MSVSASESQRVMMKIRLTSGIAPRIAAVVAAACGAAVLMVADSPRAQPSASSLTSQPGDTQSPAIQSSTPAAEATGVSGQDPLVVRFNKPMAVASLTSLSITLVGPNGAEPVNVVPLELGALAYIWPTKELLPASRYTLFVNGITDNAQHPLPLSAIGFDTAAKSAEDTAGAASGNAGGVADPRNFSSAQPSNPPDEPADLQVNQLNAVEQGAVLQAGRTSDPEDWIPGPQHFKGRWRADRAPSPLQALPPLRASDGITALSGQVLGMNGGAVRGVTLRVGDREARTDITGRFLLQNLEPGFAKMEIDGATADRHDTHYGYYAARIELKPLQTTVVPYVIWMPRLDPAGTVHIAAPTTAETVVTSPRIPGLELHIPAGTVIRDRQGRIVTELNMTAIPVDRPPFPVPDLGVPTYFTIQPGGAVLESVTGQPGPGARLFYPNFKHEVPGARGTFWNYDPEDREWFVYGLGTVSRDATQVIPDDGIVIHELTGAMFDGSNTPGPDGPPPCSNGDCEGGDPVAFATGQFDHVEHDAFLSDVIPIDITRTYDSFDVNQRSFGVGMTDAYNIFLFSQHQWQEVDLILPNNTRIHYVRTSPGTDFATAVLQSSAPGIWHNSVVARNQARAGWDLFFRNGRRWFFPQFQPLTEIADRNNNVLHIIREANNGTSGKIVQIVSPNGRSVDFGYNAAGFISTITDNIGRTYSYGYDDAGRLTTVTDPLGGIRTYTWDPVTSCILSIRDANGNVVVQNRYGLGQVIHQDLADGSSYDYFYHQPFVCTISSGREICTTSRIDYVELTDRRGTVRTLVLDGLGRVIIDTFAHGLPEQQVVNYEYDSDLLTAIVDPLNRRIEFQRDANGNITRATGMAGTNEAVSWNITWDTRINQPLTISDPNNNVVTFTHDANGNLLTMQNATGAVWTYTYDAQGRLVTSTDPLGKTMTLTYDGADLVSVTDALGRKVQFLPDPVGRPMAIRDAVGNSSVMRWDDLNRLAGSTNPLGGANSYSYDPAGNLLSQTDANGHTTSYAYNAVNQLTSVQDPLLREAALAYAASGDVAQQTDRNGRVRTMSYDALGRPTRIRYGATTAQPTAFTSRVDNTWDVVGRVTEIADWTCRDPSAFPDCGSPVVVGLIRRTYDNFDRLIREVTLQGEVDYMYDNAGRRTSMTIINGPPNAQIVQPTITYGYDAADHLVSISQAPGEINGRQARTISFAYDAAGHRTRTTLANGATVDYSYNDGGQLTTIVYKKADDTLIGDLRYEYDDAGRRSSVSGSLARMNLPTADIMDATYDAADQLLTWAGKNYQYDDQGNLITDGDNDYQWNDRNRLISIQSSGIAVARFQYDSFGRRTAKTIGSTTTGFVCDHQNVIQELSGVTSSAAVKAHLLTGGLDEVFLRLEGNAGTSQQSVVSDGSNNVLALLDPSQASVTNYTYGPYGATISDVRNSNSQQYSGRENDSPGSSQGLYYYRARYYVPGIGRFISRDTLGWASGQTNTYAYVGDNPISFIDPMGLEASQSFENFSAGLGDALLFGAGSWLRSAFGIDGVNTGSGSYTAGQVAGTVLQAVLMDGMGAGGAAASEEVAVAKESFFEGAHYSPEVLRKMEQGVGEFHSFPESVVAFEDAGVAFSRVGGDGNVVQVLEIPGSYSGRDGVFQFIKEASGKIVHRMFTPFAR